MILLLLPLLLMLLRGSPKFENEAQDEVDDMDERPTPKLSLALITEPWLNPLSLRRKDEFSPAVTMSSSPMHRTGRYNTKGPGQNLDARRTNASRDSLNLAAFSLMLASCCVVGDLPWIWLVVMSLLPVTGVFGVARDEWDAALHGEEFFDVYALESCTDRRIEGTACFRGDIVGLVCISEEEDRGSGENRLILHCNAEFPAKV